MLNVKKKYQGMKYPELVKALSEVQQKIVHAMMTRRDDPHAHAIIARSRYERAVIKNALSMTKST